MTRVSPASLSASAFADSADPLVVSATSRDLVDLREHRDQSLEVVAHERLATGEPDLRHALVRKHTSEAGDLFEGQQLFAWQEREVAPEDLLGHAVGAAEVAPVGDRDTQVAQRARPAVNQSAHARGVRSTG